MTAEAVALLSFFGALFAAGALAIFLPRRQPRTRELTDFDRRFLEGRSL